MRKGAENEVRNLAREGDSKEGLLSKSGSQEAQQKKLFTPPRVTKHGSLPKVTGQTFVGTFSP